MAWTTLPTYADGDALTAAQMNAIADNFDETAAAKAFTAGGYPVATGVNTLVERTLQSDTITTTGTTTSGSYANLSSGGVGPAVTYATGAQALIFTSCQLENSASGSNWASFDVGGATTTSASDTFAIMAQNGAANGSRQGVTTYMSLTSGSNVFTMKYRVSSGTGSFDDRRLVLKSY